jgi:hypothetical protein
MPVFLFFYTQTMHIKSIKYFSVKTPKYILRFEWKSSSPLLNQKPIYINVVES